MEQAPNLASALQLEFQIQTKEMILSRLIDEKDSPIVSVIIHFDSGNMSYTTPAKYFNIDINAAISQIQSEIDTLKAEYETL